MREERIPRRRGLLFERIGVNDPHFTAVVTLNALLEEAARDWPLSQKRGFWERVSGNPLVDVGKVEAWFNKWIGELKDD